MIMRGIDAVLAKLLAEDGKDVVGWENIELISDRPKLLVPANTPW